MSFESSREKPQNLTVPTIDLNLNGNQAGATQFDIFFDNSILDYSTTQFSNTLSTNFKRNNGSSISLGSLNTNGGSISNITYKITFKPIKPINSILGLIDISNTEGVDVNGKTLAVKIL